MNKLYFISYSVLTPEQVHDFLSNSQHVIFWFQNLPNSVFVRTNLTARQLQHIIQERFGTAASMFITEVRQGIDYVGWLPVTHLKYFE